MKLSHQILPKSIFPIFNFLIVIFLFTSCQDEETTLRQQYFSIGRMIYQDKCANCHQQNGNGLGQIYPPLNNSDYFLNEPVKTACVIKYGTSEEITVNGKNFNQEMPNNQELSAIQIAQLITYIGNAWENKGENRLVSKEEVSRVLKDCNK